MKEKSLRCSRKPCWVQQWFRSVFRKAPVCWMIWRITGYKSSFFSDEIRFTGNHIFNKQNYLVVTFINDISEHRRVSTAKLPASIIMFGVVASNGEKVPAVGFEWGYSWFFAAHKEVLKPQVFSCAKRSLGNQETNWNSMDLRR